MIVVAYSTEIVNYRCYCIDYVVSKVSRHADQTNIMALLPSKINYDLYFSFMSIMKNTSRHTDRIEKLKLVLR